LKGTYRIPVTITENREGIFNVSFSRFKDIPAVVLLKSLGLSKNQILQNILEKKQTVSLLIYMNLQVWLEREDAMMFIAEKTNLQGTKKEILDRVKQRIDSYLSPT